MSDIMTRARHVGTYTHSMAVHLQGDLGLNPAQTPPDHAAQANARAELARLRHGFDGDTMHWLTIGRTLFDRWPRNYLGDPEDPDDPFMDETLNATGAGLALYAIHQQSNHRGMALLDPDVGTAATMMEYGFGGACRALDPKHEEASSTIARRLRMMEGAPDFHGVVTIMAGLIRRMRTEGATQDGLSHGTPGVVLDYAHLGRDLFLLQFPSTRGDVFQSWSGAYFARPRHHEDDDASDQH